MEKLRGRIRHYYSLTKPGLIFGNVITVAGGFALAARGRFDFGLFFATLAGISLVIASGCVFNNYIDRDIDAKMERTKNRELVRGTVSGRSAVVYAACLGLAGILVLDLATNPLTVAVALAGLFAYLVLYSLWGKRRTVYGTLLGSIAGAVPPVVGYAAVSDRFDAGALVLFAIMVFWQMPHFFAIAIYRFDDYTAAAIPVLPVKKGIYRTKLNMVFYILAFIAAALMPTFLGRTGYAYGATAALLGAAWLGLAIKGFSAKNDTLWARKMFFVSLVVLAALFLTMAFDVA